MEWYDNIQYVYILEHIHIFDYLKYPYNCFFAATNFNTIVKLRILLLVKNVNGDEEQMILLKSSDFILKLSTFWEEPEKQMNRLTIREKDEINEEGLLKIKNEIDRYVFSSLPDFVSVSKFNNRTTDN